LIRNINRIGKSRLISFVVFTLVVIVLTLQILKLGEKRFDENDFNVNNVYKHIEELSSSKYGGRLAGTEGNIQALKYIENYFKDQGVEPGGENSSYYQQFKSIVPTYNSEPVLNIVDDKGDIIKEYVSGKDYREIWGEFGGSGEVTGKLLFIDKQITAYKASELKDKVIVIKEIQAYEAIKYAINCGVKAIFTVGNDRMPKDASKIGNKEGQTILISKFNSTEFEKLHKYAKNNYNAYFKMDYSYKSLNTPNILGKIQGKSDEYLIISANVDHVGSEFNGMYYPGALNNASGVAVMMEIARVIKTQKSIPDKTIILVGWNNKEGGMLGSKYYVDNPLYPLEDTEALVLQGLGADKTNRIIVDGVGDIGEIIRYKLKKYGQDLNINTKETKYGVGSDHETFISKGVPAVYIFSNFSDSYDGYYENKFVYTDLDNINVINKNNLKRDSSLLLSYIKYEIYKDNFSEAFNKRQIALLLLFFYGVYFTYVINILRNINTNIRIFGRISITQIYYSFGFNLIQRFYFYATPIFTIFFSLVFISHIPADFNLVNHNGKLYTNLPINLIIKDSMNYAAGLLKNGLGDSMLGFEVKDIIIQTLSKSMVLISFALIIALVFGILKGIYDGFKERDRTSIGIIGTLAALSLPDVFIVVLAQMLAAYITRIPVINSLPGMETAKNLVLPILCLALIPTVYISRIVSITVKEEMKKEYIKSARARGISSINIIKNHLLIGVVIKVMDSLSSVLTIVVSNLIVIEYLFGYSGIVNNLFMYYKEKDITTFIGLSMALGLMYVALSLLFKLISRVINPLKREGIF
jgi:ABC-type dipeptide/oligopeptide/nickel transport system permease component